MKSNRTLKDLAEVLRLYNKIADNIYAAQKTAGFKFTKGRLKFRHDVKKAVQKGMTALKTLDEVFKQGNDSWVRVSSIRRTFKENEIK